MLRDVTVAAVGAVIGLVMFTTAVSLEASYAVYRITKHPRR